TTDADRLSPDAVLEPDRPPPDTDHRRGDRGRRRGVPYGLRVGLDRPPSPVASYCVASAVADARPPGPGDGPDATQNVDAAAPAGQSGGRGREHRHPRSHHARAPRRGCVRRLPGAGAGDGGARPPGPRAEARGVARADEATLGRRGGDARGALHAGHGREAAAAAARAYLEKTFAMYRAWAMQESTMMDLQLSFDVPLESWAICGSPADCLETVARAGAMGLDRIGFTIYSLPRETKARI